MGLPAYQMPTWAPATEAIAVTKSDTTVLLGPGKQGNCRGLYVGTTGDVIVDMLDNDSGTTSVTFKAVPAGTFMPIQPTRVKAATTAADIVALF